MREQRALVGFVLQRDAHRNGLQALESSGWLEIGALLATMQRSVAFRTVAVPVDAVRQSRGTVETAGRGDRLYQARQARSGYVERWFRARGPGPLVATAAFSKIRAIRVHVARFCVFSIPVHGELRTPINRREIGRAHV